MKNLFIRSLQPVRIIGLARAGPLPFLTIDEIQILDSAQGPP